MTTTSSSTPVAEGRELVITRIFDARREVVFSVWTKAEHLAHWFGPRDFTLPFCEMAFRVGGSYRCCMRSPEGQDHWVWGEYREIVEPERLVFSWNRDGTDGKTWSSTVVDLTFVDRNGKTEFTLRQGTFETVPYREEHGFGWGQSLDRLGEYVTEL